MISCEITLRECWCAEKALLFRFSFTADKKSPLAAAVPTSGMSGRLTSAFHVIMSLAVQHHGKSRVRLGRVWREGDVHHFAEWSVNTMLDSDMRHAYYEGSNKDMTVRLFMHPIGTYRKLLKQRALDDGMVQLRSDALIRGPKR